MRCIECVRFDRENRLCLDGKVNPQTHAEAVEVSGVMGIRALCVFNDYREALLSLRKQPLGNPPRFDKTAGKKVLTNQSE